MSSSKILLGFCGTRHLRHAVGKTERAGIALVLVLGLLAFLVLSAVSFSILMRMDRLTSRNYLDVVKARNYVQVALAQATLSIDQAMDADNSRYPLWEGGSFFVRGIGMEASGNDDPVPDVLLDGDGDVFDYLPRRLETEAINQADSTALQWHDIELFNDLGEMELVGRYAYVVLDCSGFLDANIVARQPVRGLGGDPGEIRPGGDWGTFVGLRADEWQRIETLAELEFLGQRYGNLNASQLETMFVYSRFPNQFWDEAAQELRDRAFIGGDPSEADEWDTAGISGAIEDITQIPDADLFYAAMRDYATYDGTAGSLVPSDPADLDGFGVMPVPRVNEVAIFQRFSYDDPEFTHEISVFVETWAPFTDLPVENYVLRVVGDVELQTGIGDYDITISLDEEQEVTHSGGRNDYQLTRFDYVHEYDIDDDLGLPATVTFANLSDVRLVVLAGGNEVEHARPFADDPEREVVLVDTLVWSWEATDPRINWQPDHWTRQDDDHTLEEDNNTLDDVDADHVQLIYVSPEPFRSVGELSFLLYDESKPWETIALMDGDDGDNPRAVFDVFTAFRTNTVFFGQVNPNTPHDEVLDAVFNEAPTGAYPGADDSGLNPTTFRTNLINFRQTLPNEQFVNRSDMVRMDRPEGNKFEQESLLRNSIELFDTQQNLFTIFLIAEALSPTGVTLSQQRAVAVVWRDPFPDAPGATGRHPSFVRFFKWL